MGICALVDDVGEFEELSKTDLTVTSWNHAV
jgi:hypothetical protein